MKPINIKTSILTALKSFTATTLKVMFITLFISGAYINMYAEDNSLESISLKGRTDNQTDLLQWEVSHASKIAYFTVEYAKNNDMMFSEVASVNPMECVEASKNSSFAYKFNNNDDDHDMVYYRVKVTFQDNHTIESNFIGIRKSQPVASLNISEIKNQGGQVTLTFKSPKAQNITLNILSKSGQLLGVKDIAAMEGDNMYTYDASGISSSEMLIFSLNNQDEQITKKYMLASAW